MAVIKAAGKTSRAQRNFLGVYDRALKTMQLDYVDHARYATSGYADFIGRLYTLNAGMFQNPSFCDRTLAQMLMHYLAWFQDPGVRLLVGPGAAWRAAAAPRTQRCGDALYVLGDDSLWGVARGEQIVKVNGMTLDEVRPEVERTLMSTVDPVDHEREDWSTVLRFAKRVTVRSPEGCERVVETPRRRDDGAVCDLGWTCADPAGDGGAPALRPCEAELRDGVAVVTVRRPGDCGFADQAQAAAREFAGASRVVIDVRGASGGTVDDVYPLIAFVMPPGATMAPAELFGPSSVALNCSRCNVDAKLRELEEARARKGGAAPAADAWDAELDAFERELRAKCGRGLVCEAGEFYLPAEFSAPDAPDDRRTVLLTDRHTCDAAEWLVRAARSAGSATVMGRSTAGSLDNTCPRVVRLDGDFSLVVPTAKYRAALEGEATLGRGILPDVALAWDRVQLVRDAELEAACARAAV